MQVLLHLYEVAISQLSKANFVFYLFANHLPFAGEPHGATRGSTNEVSHPNEQMVS